MGVVRYRWIGAKAFTIGRLKPLGCVLLHSSDGHEAGDIETLTGPKVSSHWYITKDGRYFHFVQNSDTAWHTGKVSDKKYSNAATIGIEHEHIDKMEPWSLPQVHASANLINALFQNHGKLLIKTHADVATPYGRKIDPWMWPWKKFNDFLAQGGSEVWTFKRE